MREGVQLASSDIKRLEHFQIPSFDIAGLRGQPVPPCAAGDGDPAGTRGDSSEPGRAGGRWRPGLEGGTQRGACPQGFGRMAKASQGWFEID